MQEIFQINLYVAFKRNQNLQETAGGHTIKNGKMFKTNLEDRKEKCEPCNTNKPSKCCKLVIETSTFRSYYTQQLLHYISKAQL